MIENVVKINAPEDRRYGHTTATTWTVVYRLLASTKNSKYISIEFENGIDIVISRFYLPFAGGIRYFISVPEMSLAIPMQRSLLDTDSITIALKDGGYQLVTRDRAGRYCTYGTLSVEKAITVAHVLYDLGDF